MEKYNLIEKSNQDFFFINDKMNEKEHSVQARTVKWEWCQQPLKQHKWGDPKKQKKVLCDNPFFRFS